jgi:hypothetical protein
LPSGGDRPVLGADAPLEQYRGGREPQALVIVAGGDEGHGVAGARIRCMIADGTSASSGLMTIL